MPGVPGGLYNLDPTAFMAMSMSPEERARQEAEAKLAALRGSAGGATGTWDMPPPQAPLQPPPPGPQARPPMLPQARGATQAPPQSAPAPGGPAGGAGRPSSDDLYAAEQARLHKQQDEILAEQTRLMQPPDRSAMEAAYGKRAASGGSQLMQALLAQNAGEDYKPFVAMHLKQAAAAREPMKVAGGEMTDTGFIEDPAYQQQMALKHADARLQQINTVLERNLTKQERDRWERARLDQEAALRRESFANSRGNALIAAGAAGGGGFGGSAEQVGMDPNTQTPVFRNKAGQLFSYGPDGKPTAFQGQMGSKAQPSEGERKAATLLQRMEFSQAQLQQAVQENPAAAKPTMLTRALQGVPMVGEDAANVVMSPARRRVEAAQLDLLDAALTLGTGAAYTREQLQGYRRSYFPQTNDDAATVKDKQARLANVINSARIAAGRSAGQATAAARPAAAPGAASGGAPEEVDFANLPKR